MQAIDDTHSSLSSFTSFDTDLATIRSNTVDRVNTAIDDHSPIARTADKWYAQRCTGAPHAHAFVLGECSSCSGSCAGTQPAGCCSMPWPQSRAKPASHAPCRRGIGLYIAYGVLAGLAVVAAFAMLVDWPAAAKPLILLFLILMLLVWIFVVALTAVLRCSLRAGSIGGMVQHTRLLSAGCRHWCFSSADLVHLRAAGCPVPRRVGNDVCVNVEDKLMEAVSGSGSFSLGSGGSGKPRRLTRAAATLAWTAAGQASVQGNMLAACCALCCLCRRGCRPGAILPVWYWWYRADRAQ